MNEYRGKHAPSTPWAVASTATVPARRSRHMRKNRHRRIRIIVILLVLLVLLVYPFLEARFLTTDKVVLRSDDLPADANHLRIVFLSDIHWGFWYNDRDLNGLLTKINSLRPDLVLFGGDYATDHDSALLFFRRLQECPGSMRVTEFTGCPERRTAVRTRRTGLSFRRPCPMPV